MYRVYSLIAAGRVFSVCVCVCVWPPRKEFQCTGGDTQAMCKRSMVLKGAGASLR